MICTKINKNNNDELKERQRNNINISEIRNLMKMNDTHKTPKKRAVNVVHNT